LVSIFMPGLQILWGRRDVADAPSLPASLVQAPWAIVVVPGTCDAVAVAEKLPEQGVTGCR
jgi:hypothetical protein